MIPPVIPSIPDTICETKEICELIVEKTEGATGSKEALFTPDDVEGSKEN